MLLLQTDFLKHIRDEAAFIAVETKDLSFSDLEESIILQKALLRSLEVIGEATKRIDFSLRQKYPQVDWKAMAGTRDKLIHDYFSFDVKLVYDICKTDIPELFIEIENIIAIEESTNL